MRHDLWGMNRLAGIFEITEAGEEYFFKLTAADGTVVAVSPMFSTIKGAAAGINAVRENAATGHIVTSSHGAGRPDHGTAVSRPRGFRGALQQATV